jgi:hypothetical protein
MADAQPTRRSIAPPGRSRWVRTDPPSAPLSRGEAIELHSEAGAQARGLFCAIRDREPTV